MKTLLHLFSLILSLFFPLLVSAQTKTGCLVQNASQLYANLIGNRNPYWSGDTNPTTPAYNGTLSEGTYVPVDNRQVQDVACGSWYIKSTTSTSCLQYTNDSPPTFVSNGGNGVIATVEKKCGVTPVPLDDYTIFLLLIVSGFGLNVLRNNQTQIKFRLS